MFFCANPPNHTQVYCVINQSNSRFTETTQTINTSKIPNPYLNLIRTSREQIQNTHNYHHITNLSDTQNGRLWPRYASNSPQLKLTKKAIN